MPLSFKMSWDPNLELSIWEVTESVDYFRSKLEIHDSEREIIEQQSHRKLLEWLSSRYLLHLMSGRKLRGKFTKDIHGKPHLEDSEYHISISHSHNLVAVVASRLLVGIDIQYFVSKIHRIQHKFVNKEELRNIPDDRMMEALHVIWGAKESLYKAYGKRSLDFKKHIHVHDLDLTEDQGTFTGVVSKGEYHKTFNITYRLSEKFALVYAKECN